MPNRPITPELAVPMSQDGPRAKSQTSIAIPKKFSLAWQSFKTVTGEITGIASSTNLIDWKVEAEWPLTTESNHWTDYHPSPVKFYRAFNREK